MITLLRLVIDLYEGNDVIYGVVTIYDPYTAPSTATETPTSELLYLVHRIVSRFFPQGATICLGK